MSFPPPVAIFRHRGWRSWWSGRYPDAGVVGAVLAVAAATRVALLLGTRHLRLINDPADYQRLAVSLLSGNGFGTTVVAPGGGPTAFRPPAWPLFLAGVYKILGVHILAGRAVEVVLGVVTVALIGVLARRVAGRRVALVAMALAAVYPPLVLAGGSLLSESLSLPLELGSLLLALEAGRRHSSRRLWWCAGAGLLGGLDVLTRPDSFVLLVPLVLLAAWTWSPWRTALLRAVVVVSVAGLTVTPWLVRDALTMGRFIPVTTQAGLVASGTYNDTAAHDPNFPAAWRPTNQVPEYVHLLHGTEVQEESALRSASLQYIRTYPAYPWRVAGWNLLRLFDLTGLTDPRLSWGANGYSPGWAVLDAYGLAALAVLVVAGAARRVRLRLGSGSAPDLRSTGLRSTGLPPTGLRSTGLRSTWPVWLAPVLIVLITVPVLGESRLRVGVDPFLVLLAALAVAAA